MKTTTIELREMDEARKKELDRRLQRYADGKMVFHSWEEVKAKLDQE